MNKYTHIKTLIICLTILILPTQMFCTFCDDPTILKDERTHTVKIIFSKNETGNLRAVIIPYDSDGSHPKSGWITSDIINDDIVKLYSEKLKNEKKIEGYFTATYRKIEKDKNSPILQYKGELIKIEPWNPEFIKDTK